MLKIVTVPDKILSSPTRRVVLVDDKIKQLISNMEKTLLAQKDPKGVGLAANQVGVNLSLFIIKASEKTKTKVFINPKIIKSITYNVERITNKKNTLHATRSTLHKKKQPVKLEGCLSIPRIWGPVKRAKKILLEYQNTTGAVVRGWFQGFEATIIQHEMDHLQGVVFTQRSMEQGEKLYKEIDDELRPIEI